MTGEITSRNKELDQELLGQIREGIEWVLLPINGKVTEFLNSYEMKHSSKQGDEPWKEWFEQLHPVAVISDLEKDTLMISSRHLESGVESAVKTACHNFVISLEAGWEIREKILRRIYADDFSS